MDNALRKLRRDLIVTSETVDEVVYYTIQEPLTGRVFRLRAPEYYLLTRADGATTPDEAAAQTSERYGVTIPAVAVEAFYAKMDRMLFFDGPALERERTRMGRLATEGQQKSIWSIRLKAVNPDAFLSRLIERLRFLFHPLAVGLGFLVMAGAFLVAAGQVSLWTGSLADLWRLSSLPLLIAGILVVGAVHEFGHALTLKYFGGSVREMGFLLLYFQPCFYCNLTDAYMLPTRRARLLVGASGLFFQGVLTGLFILLWRLSQPGTIIADFLYIAVAFSLAVYLFNFNPLIRLDGYYLLADWLRIPNLRAKAFSFWRRFIAAWTFGGRAKPFTTKERAIYGVYGVLAAVYTGVLIGYLLFLVTRFINDQFGLTGVAVVYAILAVMLLRSSDDDEGGATETDASDTVSTETARRWTKPVIFWGSVVIIALILIFVHMERRVGSSCLIEPSARFTVFSTSSGTLETEYFEGLAKQTRERSLLLAVSADFSAMEYKIRYAEGDTVQAGDTIVELTSNLFLANLREAETERDRTVAERNLLLAGPKKDAVLVLRAELKEINAQLENQRIEANRAEQLLSRDLIAQDAYDAIQTALRVLEAKKDAKESDLDLLISEPKAEELAIKDAQIAGLEAKMSFLKSQIDASTVTSPIGGIITRVSRGDVVAEVAKLDPVRVELNIDEDDIADIVTGLPVTLKVRALPFEQFSGHVVQVAIDADTLGDDTRFKVTTVIENPTLALKPGMTGYAKVACGERSLLYLVTRRLIYFLRVEFWSWW